MLIDADSQRAYVAYEDNARLVVLNLSTMKEISLAQVGDTPNVLVLDKTLSRLYVTCESGIVSILFGLRDSLSKPENIYALSVHTITVNQQTHEVYLPLENIGNQPVLQILMVSNVGSEHAP